MGLTDAVQESLTETVTQDVSFANPAVWLSLHSAEPDSSGSNEVTTGAGAQGRQLVTFTGADGTDTNTAAVSVQLIAETVTWIGYWTEQESGTFLGGFPLVGAGTILAAANGDSDLTCPNHGLSIGDSVRLYPMPGPAASAVPAPFAADTVYWVVATADISHLALSATEGGSFITATSGGACGMYVDESETAASGLLTFPASNGITYITTS